jgi:hypothetical protein
MFNRFPAIVSPTPFKRSGKSRYFVAELFSSFGSILLLRCLFGFVG